MKKKTFQQIETREEFTFTLREFIENKFGFQVPLRVTVDGDEVDLDTDVCITISHTEYKEL